MEAFYKPSEKELKIETEMKNQLDNMEKRIARWEFDSWIDKYEIQKISEIEQKVKKEWEELRQIEPDKVYGISQNKEIIITVYEQLIAFKSFYLEREGKELTEEQIQFLQLKPRNIKTHQVDFLTTSDNIISERKGDDTLGIFNDVMDYVENT